MWRTVLAVVLFMALLLLLVGYVVYTSTRPPEAIPVDAEALSPAVTIGSPYREG
jgi:hypothetical protein